jgi:hypothetical protein
MKINDIAADAIITFFLARADCIQNVMTGRRRATLKARLFPCLKCWAVAIERRLF